MVFLALAPVSERASGEIEFGNRFCEDRCTEPDGLCAEFVHEFRTEDASWESGEILDYRRRIDESGEVWIMDRHTISSCGQLTTGSKSVGHETFKEDRIKVRPSQINGGGVSSRSRTDDDLARENIGTRAERWIGWEKTHDSGMQLSAPLIPSSDGSHLILIQVKS